MHAATDPAIDHLAGALRKFGALQTDLEGYADIPNSPLRRRLLQLASVSPEIVYAILEMPEYEENLVKCLVEHTAGRRAVEVVNQLHQMAATIKSLRSKIRDAGREG